MMRWPPSDPGWALVVSLSWMITEVLRAWPLRWHTFFIMNHATSAPLVKVAWAYHFNVWKLSFRQILIPHLSTGPSGRRKALHREIAVIFRYKEESSFHPSSM